jgi:rhodanese-related sulfurtransferase
MNREKAVVLDIREATEFAAGHIAAARNAPLAQLEGSRELPANKTLPVIVVCATGARSGGAAARLRKLGHAGAVAAGRRAGRLARGRAAAEKS